MTISEFTLKSSEAAPVRRFEVFTGTGRRREWPEEEKARIVAESYESEESVSAVARRYALSPQQLFAWRRAASKPMKGESSPAFVPAVVSVPTAEPRARKRGRSVERDAGVIELEIGGVTMRVARGADARTVAAVIRALKASS
jgi:transposase